MPVARASESPSALATVPDVVGGARVERLDNGLTVLLLEDRRTPIVTSALCYRVGAREEEAFELGAAHFLEHMMFKGSEHFGPGEIDRKTQALGGVNNAFTSHDLTAYYFDFSSDRWHIALTIEADRMAGLTLDPAEVASERQVICEEISMYESDPWDALEQAVMSAYFADHPYGRPVLGTRESLAGIGVAELASFHRRFYRPERAVLVVAGDIRAAALDEVIDAFGAVPAGPGSDTLSRARRAATARPPETLRHIERQHGEVARLMLALPAPAGGQSEHAALRLALTVLAVGRASRLYRRLVDEGQLCAWISSDLSDGLDPGFCAVTAELVPGAEPARVEEILFEELESLAAAPPSSTELARAKQIALADWVFGHERVHQKALLAGSSTALFELDHPRRQLERLLASSGEEVQAVAGRAFVPRRGALGWSLPDHPT